MSFCVLIFWILLNQASLGPGPRGLLRYDLRCGLRMHRLPFSNNGSSESGCKHVSGTLTPVVNILLTWWWIAEPSRAQSKGLPPAGFCFQMTQYNNQCRSISHESGSLSAIYFYTCLHFKNIPLIFPFPLNFIAKSSVFTCSVTYLIIYSWPLHSNYKFIDPQV